MSWAEMPLEKEGSSSQRTGQSTDSDSVRWSPRGGLLHHKVRQRAWGVPSTVSPSGRSTIRHGSSTLLSQGICCETKPSSSTQGFDAGELIPQTTVKIFCLQGLPEAVGGRCGQTRASVLYSTLLALWKAVGLVMGSYWNCCSLVLANGMHKLTSEAHHKLGKEIKGAGHAQPSNEPLDSLKHFQLFIFSEGFI